MTAAIKAQLAALEPRKPAAAPVAPAAGRSAGRSDGKAVETAAEPRTYAVATYQHYSGRRFVATGCSPECAAALCKTAATFGHRSANTVDFITESKNH